MSSNVLFHPQSSQQKPQRDDEIEETIDRFSELPDSILLHILSFLSAKRAVQTCILSTRYKHLWKRLPTLRLNSLYFRHLKDFTKFVSRILSLRDNAISIDTLSFHRYRLVEPHILKRVVNYAVSRNVQQLDVYVKCDVQHFPSCLFSCHTLTSLRLAVVHPKIYGMRALFPNSVDLPSLTNLSLHLFAFSVGIDGCAEPFSRLKKLKSLTLEHSEVVDAKNLCISSTTLVSLTIIIRDYPPNLCNFSYIGSPFHKLYGSKSNISSIKDVNIVVKLYANSAEYSMNLLNWLLELANIKSLTISSNTLQVLSLVPKLLEVELPSLCNMKSLKVKRKEHSFIPDGIMNFLLQNSPSAKVEIID